MATNKSEAKQYEEVIDNIVSLLAAEAGCQSTTRKIPEEYRKMLGQPLPLFGFKSLVELLRLSPDLFDLRPLQDGSTYSVSLLQFPNEQAETIAKWNERSARKVDKGYGRSNYGYGRPSAENSSRAPANYSSGQASVVKSISLDSPELQKFCHAVQKLVKEAVDQGNKWLSVDDLIALNHPDISVVNPVRYGAGGFLELLEMLSGDRFGLDVVDGVVVVFSR